MTEAVAVLDANFSKLLGRLADVLRTAQELESESRRNDRVSRLIAEFVSEHPTGATRDAAAMVLRRIDTAADDTRSGDVIRAGTARLRRSHQLTIDPLDHVDDYELFLQRLQELPLLERLDDQGRLMDPE